MKQSLRASSKKASNLQELFQLHNILGYCFGWELHAFVELEFLGYYQGFGFEVLLHDDDNVLQRLLGRFVRYHRVSDDHIGSLSYAV